jgi:hypothetical protein
MRWRRESYRQAARIDTIATVQEAIAVDLPAAIEEKLQAPVAAAVSVSATQSMAASAIPIADRFGINAAAKTVGMDPATLSRTWALPSVAQANVVLGQDASTLGVSVVLPAQTVQPNTTLEQVAADNAALAHLTGARDRLVQTAIVKVQNVTKGFIR